MTQSRPPLFAADIAERLSIQRATVYKMTHTSRNKVKKGEYLGPKDLPLPSRRAGNRPQWDADMFDTWLRNHPNRRDRGDT